jgi:predicted phage terminase large subunit-like protein
MKTKLRTVPKTSQQRHCFKPLSGPQEQFLASSADIVFFGGTIGCGKSWSLLLEALRHVTSIQEFSATYFCQYHDQIVNPGGLWDTTVKFYSWCGGNKLLNKLIWYWSKGGFIRLVGFDRSSLAYWANAEFPLLLFDDVCRFKEEDFHYLVQRNKSFSKVKPYVRAGCIADGSSWVAKFLAWWIDPVSGKPIEKRAGIVRWFIYHSGEYIWAATKDELVQNYGTLVQPRSFTYIPAKPEDNTVLLGKDPTYLTPAINLPNSERKRMLEGNWGIEGKYDWYNVQTGEISVIDDEEKHHIEEARESFAAYRRFIHPKLKGGWFVDDINNHLQQFYEDYVAKRRPKLAIEAPPQHGKSSAVVDFIAWFLGKLGDEKVIYSAFSERLGIRANLHLQRIMIGSRYKKVFPEVSINEKGSSNEAGATRNRELIEVKGKDGYFRNTTVRGSITGEGLDLGIIDDPIKGREAANSATIRQSTWEWYTDDFSTRFSDAAALLIIMTRWHIDDPMARLKKVSGDSLKVITYKALAEEDEANRKAGEALFPEHKSKSFLEERKATMARPSWESLYQQNPQLIEGEMVKREWFNGKRYTTQPDESDILRVIQSWDTAQKEKELNDPSVCTTWAETRSGYYLLDVYVQRLQYPDLRRAIINKYESCFKRPMAVLIEDKSSGQSIIQDLRADASIKIPIIAINPCTDKITRMSSCSSLIESGLVRIPETAPWLLDYETEIFGFPQSKHDDQVDSTSQFLNWVNKKQQILIG